MNTTEKSATAAARKGKIFFQVLYKGLVTWYNKKLKGDSSMMNIKTLSDEELLYANYRYKNCDGDCNSCPCHDEERRCSQVHDKIMKELAERDR